ncbi:hypothetical protein M409DRAFT_64817 [Zasmidium cellare ATCC 36951]|uniref:Helicase C-terminal domain-containing protein n=1 Tax=Zasmidium cellare ATCC 36951 TaxID=1080233 RepID=A0A6A6CWD0_ZASCE|nr:uncharacterized protein M409DRAFT_64817 [Zasmidium cellare ATCC 36951]KAF2169816.1 hypothetical protein M409DRAFT_64817 [Zasmidium cellare ATCC 36951]
MSNPFFSSIDGEDVRVQSDSTNHGQTSSATSESSKCSRSSLSLNSSAATSPGATDPFWYSRKDPNISNFLALGCLCFEDFSNSEANDSPGDWVGITTLPVLAFDQSIASNLARLFNYGWIRIQSTRSITNDAWLVFRIYLLYSDVGNAVINRSDKKLVQALEGLLSEIDTSSETWNGRYLSDQKCPFDLWASADEDNSSLFYLFNKLPSPNPRPSDIDQRYPREALEDLLDCDSTVRGLKTPLYPYQRRSAGAIVHRECMSRMELDPRYEERIAPDGNRFYYNARDLDFPRDAPLQQSCQGGILAETMGLGKTLICLALILSTRDHPPKVPVQYSSIPIRPQVASLAEMAVSVINRKSIPWKVEFERERQATGIEFNKCVQMLDQNPGSYEIPRVPIRWNRNTTLPPPQRVILTTTTIIVVPQNLLKQWRSEIQKHVETGALKVLVMEDRRKDLPPPDELRTFDVILFTRNRFDMESRDGQDSEGRRVSKAPLVCRCPYIGATRRRDCHCLQEDALYDSPLKYLHFRRIIVDEGHFFSNSNTNTVIVANRLVKADHRWSVSGTPARDLLGVEVDTSVISESKESRDALLERRRTFNPIEDRSGAIDSLGSLASTFINVEPFSQGRAIWKDYVFRHEDHRHTFSGFSTCLRRTLEGMVVKTRPEDVERDIQLPPLHHSVVRLKPSLYDIFTANLFTLVLTANAVTSERTDADYLFHPNSQRSRYQLVGNLRKSTFFWTGFSEDDVLASMSNAKKYLAKEGTGCTQEDRVLMTETLKCTDAILNSRGWKALSKSHELGVFIDEWPEQSAEHWAFDDSKSPVLTGITQLLDAQRFVNERIAQDDPGEGLSGQGIRALAALQDSPTAQQEAAQGVGDAHSMATNTDKTKIKKPTKKGAIKAALAEKQLLSKSGIPMSSIDGEPRKRNDKSPRLPMKAFRVTKKRKEKPARKPKKDDDDLESVQPSAIPDPQLRSNSEYSRARVVGTTSAKMSYLISQVMKYYQDEKILVFYEGDNIAYYIAQILELLDVKHEIYAKTLQNRLKSEYVVDFDLGADTRVLLMDVGQAAFGLNLSSASRIYFVNPVLRPQIESQAIKRAHRIGQTRRVHVETLLLQDTVEEKMFQRSKRMTAEEHRVKAVEDDGGMREIIQSSRILNVPEEQQASLQDQMASLESPEQLWARPGWRDFW